MKFGICTTVRRSAEVKASGWDYIDENARNLFQGLLSDDQWTARSWMDGAVLPVPAAAVLLPKELKVTGPAVDRPLLRTYMERVMRRAEIVGTRIIVFGSGPSRMVEGGFDRQQAREQLLTFLRDSAEPASKHGVTIVVEHLNHDETNIINTVQEAMTYVKEVNHPNVQCLLDTWHLWYENEPLEHVRAAMPWIKHVHLADLEGRVAPGESGKSDYREVFRVLKEFKYAGTISVEALKFDDFTGVGARVLGFVKRQWDEA